MVCADDLSNIPTATEMDGNKAKGCFGPLV